MIHFEKQAQLDRLYREEMEAAARKHNSPRTGASNRPVYGPALASLGRVLVMVGAALSAKYGNMVERSEQVLGRFEDGIEQTRTSSEPRTT